jgi:hypothetical protein
MVAQKPAKPALVAEKGKFRVFVGPDNAASEDFSISASGAEWSARADVRITPPGGATTKVTSKLRLDAQANPVEYEWSFDGDRKISGTITFQGGTANVELRQEGAAPFTQQFFFENQRVVILDNNIHHHYAILGRLFDWEKKGTQSFSAFIPQAMIPGTVTLESAGALEVDGAKYDVLRMHTGEVDLDLLFDKQKLARISVPTARVTVVRE